jgi:hypothetical protein
MSLQKQKIVSGVEANYWKIVEIRTDVLGNKTKVILGLYKDHDARVAYPNAPLEKTRPIILDGIDKTRAQIYTAIKAIPDGVEEENFFKDAVDLI